MNEQELKEFEKWATEHTATFVNNDNESFADLPFYDQLVSKINSLLLQSQLKLIEGVKDMKTREEIEKQIEPMRNGDMTIGTVSKADEIIIALLLDIRDLLSPNNK